MSEKKSCSHGPEACSLTPGREGLGPVSHRLLSMHTHINTHTTPTCLDNANGKLGYVQVRDGQALVVP